MKTVITEWGTLSNGDLSYKNLEKYSDIIAYHATPADILIDRIKDADAVLCNKSVMSREVLSQCKELKYIGECATGYNNIDLNAAKEFGITVTSCPAYSTDSVAQHVFALILSFYSKIHEYSESVKNGKWIKSKTFSYFDYPTYELAGKTLAIIGFGSIGKKVAKIADAFGMNIIINTRTKPENCPYKTVSKEDAFKYADILTIHCPLTDKTKKLVNSQTLSLMKPTAILINTARGPIVNEKDLANALNSNKIAGAGLDVLETEPMSETTPLKNAKNCIITPHVAWAPFETRKRLFDIIEKNFVAYLNNNPINIIN